ncbi:MAG: flagellar basal body P-ring formation chaperone FlgA [Gammaproteobacteria bacterium]
MPIFHFIIFTFLLISATTQAETRQWQDHASILNAAENYLAAHLEETYQGKTEYRLGNLDKRLKLKPCDQPLDAQIRSGSQTKGNTTIAVSCKGNNAWSIYISARIKVFESVLVTAQTLERGARITVNDLKLEEKNITTLPFGYYSEPSLIEGMIAKRTITLNSIVTAQMLQKPKLVKRGEHVSLIAEAGTIKVRMTGEALSDGTKGDLVRVRASDSKRIIDGIVIDHGVIKVTL